MKLKIKKIAKKILVFFALSCVLCLNFASFAFADSGSSSITFSQNGFYSTSDDVCSFSTNTTFTSSDVITFVILTGNETTDRYGNVGYNQQIIYTSASPFDFHETWSRTSKNNPSWSESESHDRSSTFNKSTNCYSAYASNCWSRNYNCSHTGKYVIERIPDGVTIDDVIRAYYNNGGDDFIIEDSTKDDVGEYSEEIGCLQNVVIRHLTTLDDDIVRITYSSTTTSGFNLLPEQQSEREKIYIESYFLQHYNNAGIFKVEDGDILSDSYEYYAYMCSVDWSVRDMFSYAYENLGAYDYEENKYKTWAEWGNAFLTQALAREKCTCDIFVRPFVYRDGKKLYGGWTKLHMHYNEQGEYDKAEVSNGLTAGTSIDDFKNFEQYLPNTEQTIFDGQGTTIDDAESNVDYDKGDGNNWSFDLSNIEDIGSYFTNMLKSLLSSLGEIPLLLKTVFAFLPDEIIMFLGCGLVVVVILRIFGR